MRLQDIKEKIDVVINEYDTPAGKIFDVLLIVFILIASFLTIAGSVESVKARYGFVLEVSHTVLLVLFTIEYMIRIWVTKDRRAYALSFYGIVDLLAIAPSFAGIFFVGISQFSIIRVFRLLRLFSVLKMGRYIQEFDVIIKALRASRAKISVFLFSVLFIVMVVGSIMYAVEGPENGFTSIPESMYWAVVTISTVGYGDISPNTDLGKVISSFLMIVGYGIIAVPTGIVTSEITLARREGGKKGRS